MKIAIIGAGMIGGTVGALLVKARHDVFFATRHPKQLADLSAARSRRARFSTVMLRAWHSLGPASGRGRRVKPPAPQPASKRPLPEATLSCVVTCPLAFAPLNREVLRKPDLGHFLGHTMTTTTKRAKVDRVRPSAILAFYKNTKPNKTVTAFS